MTEQPAQPRVWGNAWRDLTPPVLGAWKPELSVSVVIPAHQAAETLPYCLAGLAAQTYPAELLQVVVVDDGSTPAVELPELRPENTSVLRTSESWGRAHACRQGAEFADGDVIHWLDSDMLLHHDEVEAQLRWHHLVDYAVVLGPQAVHGPDRGHAVGAGRLRGGPGRTGRQALRRPVDGHPRLGRGVRRQARRPERLHVPRLPRARRRQRVGPAGLLPHHRRPGLHAQARRGRRARLPARAARRAVRPRPRGALLAPRSLDRDAPAERGQPLQPSVRDRPDHRPAALAQEGPQLLRPVAAGRRGHPRRVLRGRDLHRRRAADRQRRRPRGRAARRLDRAGRRAPSAPGGRPARRPHAARGVRRRAARAVRRRAGGDGVPRGLAAGRPGRLVAEPRHAAPDDAGGQRPEPRPAVGDDAGRHLGPLRAHVDVRPGAAAARRGRGPRRRGRRRHRLLVVRRPRGGLHARLVARGDPDRRPDPRRRPADAAARGHRPATGRRRARRGPGRPPQGVRQTARRALGAVRRRLR